jgi:hypothetical protein
MKDAEDTAFGGSGLKRLDETLIVHDENKYSSFIHERCPIC